MDHQVEIDAAGWGNWTRLTCYTCEGQTLLHKPYMNLEQWREAVAEFARKHPSPEAKELLEKLSG